MNYGKITYNHNEITDRDAPAEAYAVKVNGQYLEAALVTGLRQLEQQAADLDAANAVLSLDNAEMRKALENIRGMIMEDDPNDTPLIMAIVAEVREALHADR
jgi:hypothetical protein